MCPISLIVKLALQLATSSVAYISFIQAVKTIDIAWSEDDQWHVRNPHQSSILPSQYTLSGTLCNSLYHSQFVVVIAIQPQEGKVQHIMVWRDAVSVSDFSWLQMRLSLHSS